MCDLSFKEDTHSYFLGDLPIPSVSEIIKPIYQNESIKAEQNGDKETAESKLRQAEMIENLEKYTAKVFSQTRWNNNSKTLAMQDY